MRANIVTGSARLNGRKVSVTYDVPLFDPPPDPAPVPPKGAASHSPDFGQVNWFGVVYYFATREERSAVAHLWHAAAAGLESLDQDQILDAADCRCPRLRDLFGRHPAWGTMIVQDLTGKPGHYKLSQAV